MSLCAHPTPAAAGVVFKNKHVLLVAKKHEPLRGQWGFPGGKIKSGETILDAAKRECLEETGINVEPVCIVDALDIIDPSPKPARHYILNIVLCRFISGNVVAADDAGDANWYNLGNLPSPLIETVPAMLCKALHPRLVGR